MTRNEKQNRNGFTLLEIVVSITLLALIALMLARVFNESSKTIGRGQQDSLLDDSARMVLDYLENDISQAIIRTNVAFRVYTSPQNATLYCISPAARKLHDGLGRDTAQIRYSSAPAETGNLTDSNRSLIQEAPDNATGGSPSSRIALMNHSDYSFNGSNLPVEFGTSPSGIARISYIRSMEDSLKEHAVLTFMDIAVNGNLNWKYSNTDTPPNPIDMPRFVDISIGLISSKEMNIAQLKNDGQYVRNHEQVYFRRIHLHNRAPETLSFK